MLCSKQTKTLESMLAGPRTQGLRREALGNEEANRLVGRGSSAPAVRSPGFEPASLLLASVFPSLKQKGWDAAGAPLGRYSPESPGTL